MPISLGTIMMALGTFRFGVNRASYQMFTRDAAYRWAKQDRLGRDPALQYLGPDAEEITLEGVIYPHFKGGLRQMELMRAVARQGVPMMLVDGLGFVWQRWVITRVSETKSLFLADGAPRRIEFNVTLRAYGSDRA
jgi:phage protein U